MLPFVVNHLLVAEPSIYWGPTHLLLVAAFFILILVETDRLPIHSSTHIEVYMIDEARILEYSGPMLAILRWASMMKQFILYTIFSNVLLFPWALSYRGTPLGVVGSLIALLGKFLVVACVVVVGGNEPVAPSVLSISRAARRLVPARDPRHRRHAVELSSCLRRTSILFPLSLFSLLAIGSLLLSFVMLGSRWLRHYLYAFAAQSWLIAMLSAAVGFYGGYAELYIVAVLTAAFRGLLLPYLILRIIRRLEVSREIHVILQASSSLVIGAFAVLFALAVSYRIGAALDLAGTIVVLALTVMLSMKLIGFLMLSVRHEAISQILGLLVLENGVFLGAQILVPGMPLLIEIVILFDLLVVVACFGVLVRYLLTHVGTTSSLAAQATGGLMNAIGFLALAMIVGARRRDRPRVMLSGGLGRRR